MDIKISTPILHKTVIKNMNKVNDQFVGSEKHEDLQNVMDHPFFGMHQGQTDSIEERMKKLRNRRNKNRYE